MWHRVAIKGSNVAFYVTGLRFKLETDSGMAQYVAVMSWFVVCVCMCIDICCPWRVLVRMRGGGEGGGDVAQL